MNIALIAHDSKKELMIQFCIAYCGILSRHNLCATGTTGKQVSEAKAILMNTPKAATEPVLKLLNSAVANAENNLEMNKDNLYVAEIYANMGPTLKRFRPRAQGRATSIRKRTSNITIVLDEAK